MNKILAYGINCPPARQGMPSTKVLPTANISIPFSNGFPILTSKKMPFYSILAELICFMQGKTDVRAYSAMGCNVWWDNAYKWNVAQKSIEMSKDDYKRLGKDSWDTDSTIYSNNDEFVSYELGRIYAAQWRNWNPYVEGKDQLKDLIEGIVAKPTSRYHVMTAWNPSELYETSQPNCHVYFQATAIPKTIVGNHHNLFLDDSTTYAMSHRKIVNNLFTHLTQRSCDAFLGVPFNITSYALFTILLGILTNSEPIRFDWVGVDNHIYSDHETQVNKYLASVKYTLPKLHIEIDRIDTLDKIMRIQTIEDLKKIFWLVDYQSGEKITAPLSVGK